MNLFKSLSALSLSVAVLGAAVLAPTEAHAGAKSKSAHHVQKRKTPVFKRIVLPPRRLGGEK
jgi:hypothetical protein